LSFRKMGCSLWWTAKRSLLVLYAPLFTSLTFSQELIKVKGYQVAPSELESQLLESDDVKDCAVIRVIR
jgi:acyl-CoA synthetase (AMP-forming)/AMP-acid ligase II